MKYVVVSYALIFIVTLQTTSLNCCPQVFTILETPYMVHHSLVLTFSSGPLRENSIVYINT